MSEGFEAAGALATAGLAAGALEGAKGRTGGGESTPVAGHGAHTACLNCGATLTGRYCAVCGQSSHVHQSLLHLAEEVLHGLLHFDAKGWRTLPLLIVQPGVLTRRYIEGQRARYVSPLALFLFMVFLMFFAASLTNLNTHVVDRSGEARIEAERDLARARTAFTKAEARLAKARTGAGGVVDAAENVAEAQQNVEEAETAVRAITAVEQAMAVASAATSRAPRTAPGSVAVPSTPASGASTAVPASSSAPSSAAPLDTTLVNPSLRDMIAITLGGSKIDTGSPRLDAAITNAAANPDLTAYKLKNTAYKFSFLLVPLSLPFLWLLFMFRRDVAMYDHAVFVLYSLSFMSLLFVVEVLVSAAGASTLAAWVAFFAPPIHMGVQLRGAYGLGLGATLWRTAVLLVSAVLVLSVFVLFILYMTMA